LALDRGAILGRRNGISRVAGAAHGKANGAAIGASGRRRRSSFESRLQPIVMLS
jgi:hypothetical protein